jgi:hypothetical protein
MNETAIEAELIIPASLILRIPATSAIGEARRGERNMNQTAKSMFIPLSH